ncbi:MBG domain-containing protein, partial [Azospira sp. I13]|uniref:MBG domain-containing protein n=1 Tax=Azospira sp. I13 TaxID=1765050 RepID=UPI000D59FF7A
STLDITNEDFLAGKLRFTRNGATGAILNQGELKAGDGGLVALLAPTVKNEGIVSARLGSVALAAGDKVTLEGGANGFLQVAVAPATVKTLIENKQMIVADGGQVVMTSKAADALSAGVVANSGSVQARTLQEKEGKILLLADMSHGEVQHSGVLDASAPTSGNGGFVETSAAKVSLPGNRKVTTLAARGKSGTWLIDPNDFLIGSGPYGGPPGNISGDTLSNDLTQGNVTISTATQGSAGGNGDIFVNDRVHWGANKLTLSAERNIYVNGVLDGSGSASLSLEYSQGQPSGGNGNYFIPGMINLPAGQNFSTRNGSSGTLLTYQVITSLGSAGSSNGTDLQGMRGNLSGRYVLGADIDASATRNWNSGAGFTPIGNFSTVPFQGSLDGLGHSISNLTINRPDTDMVGLFGGTTDATRLSNLWLENVDIKGYSQVGAIAGYFGGPSVYGIHVSGKVSGISEIGGLVGRLGASNSAEVTESHANVTVTASGNNAGGIVGDLMASSYASVNLYNLYSTGAVSANQNAGGIIGRYAAGNSGNTILSSVHASGPVTALANANGVLGQISSSGNAYMPVLVLYAAYWDSTSTGQSQGAPTSTLIAGSGASAVSSALGNLSAYSSSAYAGLGAWTCSGRRCVTGSGNNSWILFEGETRPFLSSEVGVAVSNAHQLQLISPIHSHYLTRDIDLSEINQAVAGTAPGSMWRSTGFVPLGDMANPFKGGIHGQGHVIRDLTIHRPTEDNVGLIGYSGSTFIEQLGLQNADIRGNNNVGALLGNIPSNSYSEIQESYSTGSVSGNGISVGGLIGSAYGNDWNMGLRRSFSSASVQGHNAVGGLIGSLGTNDYSIVVLLRDSYASGSVHSTGDDFSTKNGTGGLIGHVNAGDYGNTIIVSNSYASGAVSAEIGYLAGGLVGQMSGLSTPSVQDSLWNVTTTGRSNSAVGTGLSNTQMRQAAAFANWDIATQGGSNAIWRIYEGDSQPLLRAFLTPATLNGVANVSKVYDGQAFAGGTADAPNTQADKLLFGGTAQGAINAGTYSLRAYSEQLGYDLNGNRDATVSVAPKAITVIADAVSKVYGNADPALTWSTSGLVAGDVLSGSLNRAGGSNAGTYAINQGSLANSNYAITFQGANFSITPRPLSIIADAVSRLYGDADPAFTWQFAPGNSLLGGDTLSGSLGRQAGNNVGVYAITPGTLGNPNYSLAVQSGTLSITPRALTVTAQADSKVYGNADPLLAWSAPNLVNGDTLSGALSRSAGENVGSYAIGRGSLDNTNYTITFVGDTFAITPRPIVLQAGNQSRSYGQANPTTGFLTLSSGSLANGDTLG